MQRNNALVSALVQAAVAFPFALLRILKTSVGAVTFPSIKVTVSVSFTIYK